MRERGYLVITDATGNRIAFNDDHEDRGFGLTTHHADSYLAVTLPTNGLYFVQIGDAQNHGGTAYSYRLRISAPQPDFALRIVPSTVNIRANANQPITLYALRSDGFNGEISLALKDGPSGFVLSGGTIPANENKVFCTLTAPGSSSRAPVSLRVEGHSTISGTMVSHLAVPAQQMTQAFSYQQLVPSDDLLVAVTEKFAPDSPSKVLSTTPIKIPMNGTAQVTLSVPHYSSFDTHEIRLLNPPNGITLKSTSSNNGRMELLIEADTKIEPGLKGNLIVVFVFKDPTPPGAPRVNPKRVHLGSLPAIPFEMLNQTRQR